MYIFLVQIGVGWGGVGWGGGGQFLLLDGTNILPKWIHEDMQLCICKSQMASLF